MKTPIKIIWIICYMVFYSCYSLAQPLFGYYYTNVPGGNNNSGFPLIVSCPDGSIIGTNSGITGDDFILFKVDMQGNMLWKKQVMRQVLGNFLPYDITLLADSTLAILLTHATLPGTGFVIIKCDLAGNLLWANKYYNFPPVSFEIAPFGPHGMMVTQHRQIAYINGDGTINKSWEFTNQTIDDILGVEDMGNGNTKVYGKAQLWGHIFILDLDSMGSIHNQYEFSAPNDTINIPLINPSELICKGPGGSIYCAVATVGAFPKKSALFHFDAQNQPLWAIKLQNINNIRNIQTTVDSGCIVTADYINNAASSLFAAKFNSTGTISWMRFPGDNSSQNPYNYSEIKAITRDTGSGWYAVMERPNLQIFHTDSSFGGICMYQNLMVSPTSLLVVSNTLTDTTTMIMMTESVLDAITVTNLPWYRYDTCTGQPVDSSTGTGEIIQLLKLGIFPNPATKNVTIEIPGNIDSGEITLFNKIGEKILIQRFAGQSSVEIQLHDLSGGIYFLQLRNEKTVYTGKVIKTD